MTNRTADAPPRPIESPEYRRRFRRFTLVACGVSLCAVLALLCWLKVNDLLPGHITWFKLFVAPTLMFALFAAQVLYALPAEERRQRGAARAERLASLPEAG
jgi:hypothetical protein